MKLWKLESILLDEKKDVKLTFAETVFEIGRKKEITNGLVCLDPRISKNHAQILQTPDGLLEIQDLGSSNSTFINNNKISSYTLIKLKENDEIGFGMTRFNSCLKSIHYVYTLKSYEKAKNNLSCIEIINLVDDETELINSSNLNDKNVISDNTISDNNKKISDKKDLFSDNDTQIKHEFQNSVIFIENVNEIIEIDDTPIKVISENKEVDKAKKTNLNKIFKNDNKCVASTSQSNLPISNKNNFASNINNANKDKSTNNLHGNKLFNENKPVNKEIKTDLKQSLKKDNKCVASTSQSNLPISNQINFSSNNNTNNDESTNNFDLIGNKLFNKNKPVNKEIKTDLKQSFKKDNKCVASTSKPNLPISNQINVPLNNNTNNDKSSSNLSLKVNKLINNEANINNTMCLQDIGLKSINNVVNNEPSTSKQIENGITNKDNIIKGDVILQKVLDCDNLIEITSDENEDDYNLVSSQLFVKQEDNFQAIKNKLNQILKNNEINNKCVASTSKSISNQINFALNNNTNNDESTNNFALNGNKKINDNKQVNKGKKTDLIQSLKTDKCVASTSKSISNQINLALNNNTNNDESTNIIAFNGNKLFNDNKQVNKEKKKDLTQSVKKDNKCVASTSKSISNQIKFASNNNTNNDESTNNFALKGNKLFNDNKQINKDKKTDLLQSFKKGNKCVASTSKSISNQNNFALNNNNTDNDESTSNFELKANELNDNKANINNKMCLKDIGVKPKNNVIINESSSSKQIEEELINIDDMIIEEDIKLEKVLDYSMNDDLIEIESDEDDYNNMVCSQLFVKQEAFTQINEVDPNEVIDIEFLDIKKELGEMDHLDYIPKAIDLDSDDDLPAWYEDEDLLKKLDELEQAQVVVKNEVITNDPIKDIEPNDFRFDINVLESIDIIHTSNAVNLTIAECTNKTDDDKKIETCAKPKKRKSVIDTPIQNFLDTEVLEDEWMKGFDAHTIPNKRQKIVAPILIEAPPLVPKQRQRIAKEKAITKIVKKVEKKETAQKRKRSTSIEMPLDKETITHIHEARKKKLKEIAKKKLVNEKTKADAKKVASTKVNVKVSNLRSDFMLPKNVAPTKLVIPPKLIDSSVPNDDSIINLENTNKLPKIPKCIKPKIDKQLETNRSPCFNDNIGGNFRNNHTNKHRNNNTSTLRTDLAEHEDIIFQLIKWSPNWCEEQQNIANTPPLTAKSCVKMCKSYASYQDYYDVLHPLIFLDFWYSVSKAFNTTLYHQNDATNRQASTIMANIINVYKAKTHMEIVCASYLLRKQRESGEYLREKSFAIVAVPIEGPKRTFKKMFGIVAWIDTKPLKPTDDIDEQMANNCGGIPETKLTFMLIVKIHPGVVSKKCHLIGRFFHTLPLYLRLFTSVKSVQHSPLCQFILQPKINDFIIPYIPNKQKYNKHLKSNLNDVQKDAVAEASYLSSRKHAGIYLIEGPPGTGKSTVISNIIMQVLLNQKDACILLLAPSNGAIDSLINLFVNKYKPKLAENERHLIKLVRIGNKVAINPNLISYTLDELAKKNMKVHFFREHPQTKLDYNALSEEISLIRMDLANNIGNKKDLEKLLKEKMITIDQFVKNYMNNPYKYNKQMDDNRNIIVQGANLICSTLGSAHGLLRYPFLKNKCSVCIIDEATQSSETETLAPLALGINKLILVGDPQQLPAVTSSILLKKFDYGKSLFARIKSHFEKHANNPIKMLNVQYRMQPEIAYYPSHTFYNGLLKNGPTPQDPRGLHKLNPYIVFNQNVVKYGQNQYCNTYEVDIIAMLVEAIIKLIGIETAFSIGIITPYSNQRDEINRKLATMRNGKAAKITCNTVDSFQGQEKDVILLSCVRNSANSFLADEQRLNVALTRARYALYVVGMQSLFENCATLSKLKSDAERRKLFFNVTCHIDTTAFGALIRKKI